MAYIQKGCTDDVTYASTGVKKNTKSTNAICKEKKLLTRQFSDNATEIFHLVCFPNYLRQEVIYETLNTETFRHICFIRIPQEFTERFYFPGFIKFLKAFKRNCFACPTLTGINKKQLNPPLQPASSEQLFQIDRMQIDLVDLFSWLKYKNAVSGINVFPK